MKPIWVWHGFIADGHNRYNICQKHKIPFNIVKLGYETKSEVMKWMIEEQLGRRNLTSIQRIAIAKKYEGKFREEAKENQGKRNDLTFSPIGDEVKSKKVSKEIAKLADVGTGTLARYDVVMKSDDEDTKKKMLSEEISINAAYNTIRPKPEKKEKEQDVNIEETQPKQQEESELEPKVEEKPIQHLPEQSATPTIPKLTPTTKKCLKCKQEKLLSEFKEGSDFCNECMKHINEPIQDDSYIDDSTEVGKIVKELKTEKIIDANFGRSKNDPIKQDKVYGEYEKLCGVRQGNNQYRIPNNSVSSQEQIAKELGVSVDTIQNLKRLQTLSPELQELISDGKITATTGYKVLAKLSEEEQKSAEMEVGQILPPYLSGYKILY